MAEFMTENDRINHRAWVEYRESIIFQSIAEIKEKVNVAEDNLVIPSGWTASCILTKPEDLLIFANKLRDVSALERAGLFKEVIIKEHNSEEELIYLEEELEYEKTHYASREGSYIIVSALDFDMIDREVYVPTDPNPFMPRWQQIEVSCVTEERGDYSRIPQVLTNFARNATYPCMLLVSDHSESDRIGSLEVRHTMLLDLPLGVIVPEESLKISLYI